MITCVEVEVPKDFSSANDYLSRALVASASLLVRTPVSLCCCSALNFLLRRDCSAGAVATASPFLHQNSQSFTKAVRRTHRYLQRRATLVIDSEPGQTQETSRKQCGGPCSCCWLVVWKFGRLSVRTFYKRISDYF